MKKIIFMLVCLVTTLCANAQTTGSLYPQNKSVYVPETYNNIMEVSYDNLIDASKAKVVLSVGTESSVLTPTNVTEYGFNLDILATLQKMGKAKDNTVFTVKVSNVLPADTIINVDPDFEGEIEAPTQNTYVEDVEGIYLLRSSYPTATANPAEGVLESTDATVEVKFSEAVKVEDIFFLSGSRGAQYSNYVAGPESYSDNLSVEILTKYWNLTNNPANMQVRLGNVTVAYDGIDWIVPDYVYNYTYQAPVTAAEFVGLDPNPDETTVWDVYMDGWGFVNFLFSDVVSLTETSMATVTYTINGRNSFKDFALEDLWADWDWWTGYYAITVPLYENATANATNLTNIKVQLYDVNLGSEIKDELVANYSLMVLPIEPEKAPRVNNTSGINLTESSKLYNVYTVTGEIIKSNVTTSDLRCLPKGLYIVNGKKIVVR